VSFGFCELWEWVYLTFDPLAPHIAHIKVRRWIAFPWWRRQQFLNDSHFFTRLPLTPHD